MIKKIFSILLICLLVLNFSSCGSANNAKETVVEKVTESAIDIKTEEPEVKPEAKSEAKPEIIQEPEKTEFAGDNVSKEPTVEKKEEEKPVTQQVEEKKVEEPVVDPVVEPVVEDKPQATINDYKIDFLANDGSREVYAISAESSRGYNINSYLSIPKNVGLNHLVVNVVKIGTQQSYEKTDEAVKSIAIGKRNYSHRNETNKLNAIVLYITLPETNMRDGNRHLELDPVTLTGDNQFSHLDDQVCNVINDAIDYLSKEKSIVLPSKVDMIGYSGEGDFIVRFALLHPDKLWAVCAGGLSWVAPLPVASFKGEALNYPMGINDVKKYSSDFKLDDWKQIRFYCDMGLLDDRGSYYKSYLNSLNWTTHLSYAEVWAEFCQEFVKYTQNAEMVSYHSIGHEYITKDYVNFLKQNDSGSFTKITPVNSATVYTHDSVEEMIQEVHTLSVFMKDKELRDGSGFGTKQGYNYLVVKYDGNVISDYTFSLSNENYGRVSKDGNGTLSLYTEQGNSEGSYITISYKDKEMTFHWSYPDR